MNSKTTFHSDNRSQERIFNVSQSQLSVARFYGGCKFNGASYHYDASSDTLTRLDVWKAQAGASEEANKSERERWMKAQQHFAGF